MPDSATPRLLNGPVLNARHNSRGGNVDQPAIYKYEPLRDRNDIRLLTFRPGKLGDIIWADLETVGVGAGRNCYDAISYTWADENGDSAKCCVLKIGSPELLLPITRNCNSVLRRVHKHTDRVWIDAVCIDQDNVRERGTQVDMMPLIYKGASRTFAYVGEASEDSDLVLKNLTGGIWTPPYLLDSFFARPYFSRVWVVQEFALSENITMMCGDTVAQWTELMEDECLQRVYTSSYFETFPTILRLDQRYLISSATMLDALLLGRSCNASDPRDKVFGLLGVVSSDSRPSANYSMSIAEVYTQIAMYLLKVQKLGLHLILGNLCHRSDEGRAQTENLPSWVPDWSQCGPTLLQRVPQAVPFLHAQDPILEYKNEAGLFFKGNVMGTLKDLEEHVDIVHISIHLSNSRSRTSRTLPPAYDDVRVYVFIPTSRDKFFRKRTPLLPKEWKAADRSSLKLIPRTFQYSEYAFLLAHAGGGGRTSEFLASWRDNLEFLEFRRDAEGIRYRRAEVINFELLGLVQIQSNVDLLEIASEVSSLGGLQPMSHTSRPRTIRIV